MLRLMNVMLYEKLIEIASSRSTVFYEDLAKFLGLEMSNQENRFRLGVMLDEINAVEHKAGRPMLSAVVVRKNDGLPGAGFFECARAFSVLTTRERQAS